MTKSNLELWDKVRTVPPEAMKPITGGRLKGMTDINAVWRIKTLTEQFGPCGLGWYVDVVKERLEPGANGEIAAFTNILLYVKNESEWSKGIPAVGGSMFVAKETSGLRTNDEAFKMAYTDALSVACKALGIGADVYFEKDSSKYTANVPDNKQQETSQPVKQTAKQTVVPPVVPPVDAKKAIIKHIGAMVYPDMTATDKGAANGYCYEIYSTALTAYNSLDKNVKELKDLSLDKLQDMEQKMDVPPVLR